MPRLTPRRIVDRIQTVGRARVTAVLALTVVAFVLFLTGSAFGAVGWAAAGAIVAGAVAGLSMVLLAGDTAALRRRIPPPADPLIGRVLDAVVATETHRPWDPTTLAWPTPTVSRPVLLLPGAAYHLTEIVPLARSLRAAGVDATVAIGRPHWDRVADGLPWFDEPYYELPPLHDLDRSVAAVVAMKDWAGYGVFVEAANSLGLPTFAKVEGAQDFDDVDTGQDRRPYRTASTILCQGKNDFDALEGDRRIVGSTRLERLWLAPPQPIRRRLAVINLNFTYGVLTDARKLWLETATAGCEAAGIDYVVALHPAESRRTLPRRATTIPISRLLAQGSVLISRFSTVPFEAMARGIPFIYHNPHGEQVATFAAPGDAFRTTVDAGQLADALAEVDGWADYRERAAPFFFRQVDIDPGRPSERRAAEIVAAALS